MDWEKTLPVLLTISISILGWFIVHRLSKKRDIENARKELRIKYLIETWKKLEYSAHRKNIDLCEYLEKPLAEIQLFGTLKQIKLAHKVIDDMALNSYANTHTLLNDLRQSLREELNLEQAEEETKHLRIKIPK